LAEVMLKVEGIDSDESRLAVTNALRKYSGVLEVDFSPGGGKMRVRYEPYNILAEDLKETIQQEGFRVSSVRE